MKFKELQSAVENFGDILKNEYEVSEEEYSSSVQISSSEDYSVIYFDNENIVAQAFKRKEMKEWDFSDIEFLHN